MKRYILMLACILAAFGACLLEATAQDASTAVFEGHVFDAKTLRPLSNVDVEYEITSAAGGSARISVATDDNGFYTLEFLPPTDPPLTVALFATCATRKGNVLVNGKVLYPFRTEIYRRDFYVALPRGASRCNL